MRREALEAFDDAGERRTLAEAEEDTLLDIDRGGAMVAGAWNALTALRRLRS